MMLIHKFDLFHIVCLWDIWELDKLCLVETEWLIPIHKLSCFNIIHSCKHMRIWWHVCSLNSSSVYQLTLCVLSQESIWPKSDDKPVSLFLSISYLSFSDSNKSVSSTFPYGADFSLFQYPPNHLKFHKCSKKHVPQIRNTIPVSFL